MPIALLLALVTTTPRYIAKPQPIPCHSHCLSKPLLKPLVILGTLTPGSFARSGRYMYVALRTLEFVPWFQVNLTYAVFEYM